MKYHLTLEIEDFGSRSKNVGECIKTSPNHYRLRIDAKDTVVGKVGTLLHEIGHVVAWIFLGDEPVKPEREERFCDQMDQYGKNKFKEMIGA